MSVAELRALNERYIEAFINSDVEWYRDILSDDFVCIESDGTVLNSAQFLEQAGRQPDVKSYKLQETNVRLYGDIALVQATGAFIKKDGSAGLSRYTDVYLHNVGQWKVISAQITRTD
ncbi:MAG: Bona fide RidAYjgFTdcFRutC subgroup [Acidobacteriales bacterium]|nr:Bona fide RidAYjgFTdcFRutC subgroup [Terriglobales bacterium]